MTFNEFWILINNLFDKIINKEEHDKKIADMV